MSTGGAFKTTLLVIAWLTVVSGVTQVVSPAFVLGFLHADTSPAPAHFFGIIGMFMALFGGLLIQSLAASRGAAQSPLLWCGLQKLGAAVAVGIGVGRGLFSILALGVAGFDLLSGLAILAYRKQQRAEP